MTAKIIDFPMKRRMGEIQAALAFRILNEVIDIPDEELKEDLVYDAHNVILEFINENDPTNDEVEEFALSFGDAEMYIITLDDPDNDN